MTDVILLERIEKLGQLGDVVKVKPGYARNFLLPQKKALRANAANKALFDSQRHQIEAANLQRRSEAEQVAEKVQGLALLIVRQAGETGLLYGSVSGRDVADAIKEAGFTIERRQVNLDAPIKTLGTFAVRISLHPEVSQIVSVTIARSQEEAARAAAAKAAQAEEVVEEEEEIDEIEEEDEFAVDEAEELAE